MLPLDHSLIHFVSEFTRPHSRKVKRTSRKLPGIQSDDVKSCLDQKPFNSLTDTSVDELVNDDDVTMTGVFNTLAPEKTKVYHDKPRAPWFCDKILEHRKEVRKLERRYKANPIEINE